MSNVVTGVFGSRRLEAGDLKAGVSGLADGSGEVAARVADWLRSQMFFAEEAFQSALWHVCQEGSEDPKWITLHKAHQAQLMLLWLAQSSGLRNLANEFDGILTHDSATTARLRIAQDVARASSRRST
jgi:hypothetical protein